MLLWHKNGSGINLGLLGLQCMRLVQLGCVANGWAALKGCLPCRWTTNTDGTKQMKLFLREHGEELSSTTGWATHLARVARKDTAHQRNRGPWRRKSCAATCYRATRKCLIRELYITARSCCRA